MEILRADCGVRGFGYLAWIGRRVLKEMLTSTLYFSWGLIKTSICVRISGKRYQKKSRNVWISCRHILAGIEDFNRSPLRAWLADGC